MDVTVIKWEDDEPTARFRKIRLKMWMFLSKTVRPCTSHSYKIRIELVDFTVSGGLGQ